jgi:MFS family permease
MTVTLQEEQHKMVVVSFREDIRKGILWWWCQPTLRVMTLLTAGRTVIASGLSLLVIVIAKQQHASSAFIGIIFALSALGGIGGALFARQLHQRLGFRRLFQVTTVCSWLIFTCYAFAFNSMLLTIVTAAFFVISPLYEVTTSIYIASHVPDHIQGRITSLSRLIILSSFSLGSIMIAFSLQFFGSLWTVSIFSALLFFVALVALFHPAVQNAS